jgi:hypothetical protein
MARRIPHVWTPAAPGVVAMARIYGIAALVLVTFIAAGFVEVAHG